MSEHVSGDTTLGVQSQTLVIQPPSPTNPHGQWDHRHDCWYRAIQHTTGVAQIAAPNNDDPPVAGHADRHVGVRAAWFLWLSSTMAAPCGAW